MKVSETLIKAIEDYNNGDQVAFTTIYNESNRYIYVCINNVVSGNDNKEEMICDIMQDTYVEISKHIDSLQNASLFLSWAGTIATRKCYEYIKKSGKYVLLNEDESFDTLADDDNIIPEEIMQNKEKQNLLREIIQNELTEMQKLCIVGYFYNEMKQSEIAEELGVPENSVKSHLLRAKAKIKDAVVDLEKNKGTKLYSVSPLLLLLFADEVQTCVVSSAIGQTVLAGIGLGGAQTVATGVGAAGTSTASASGATTVTATTVEAGVAGTSVGTTATTVATTAAKGALAAFKVKAIAIATAATLTVAGAGAGVGIAIHNKNEAKETEVTTEETTKEVIEEESVATELMVGECGMQYKMAIHDNWHIQNEIMAGVEKISVSQRAIVVELFYLNNYYGENTKLYCQLVHKKTGEIYKSVISECWEVNLSFDNDINIDDYYVYLSYEHEYMGKSDCVITDAYHGLLYEIPSDIYTEEYSFDNIVFNQCEEWYENYAYTYRDIDDKTTEVANYSMWIILQYMAMTKEKVVLDFADTKKLDRNEHIDYDWYEVSAYYQLIDKNTGKEIKTIKKSIDETVIVFDKNYDEELVDVNFEDCFIRVSYAGGSAWFNTDLWLYFEMPGEEPDDGLKSTLIGAAEKVLEVVEESTGIAFVDYDGDKIPEFLVIDFHWNGKCDGKMYKYQNNEYVYYMDIEALEMGYSKLYKNITDGSYAVLEISYMFFIAEEDPISGAAIEGEIAMSVHNVHLVNVNTKERIWLETKYADDYIYMRDRTFYNDDGTTMTADEFYESIEEKIPPQYEFVADLHAGYKKYYREDSELKAAYNYYLLNRYTK